MSELLATYLARYLHDEDALARSLTGPVFLFEPPEDPTSPVESAEYRYKTLSLAGVLPPPGGEPVLVRIRKHKDNAFIHRVTVGRTRNNDVVFDSPSVSRFHAWLEEEGGVWQMADAGSKNGTFLAGQGLSAKKLVPLADEDRIRFGEVEVRFLSAAALLKLLRTRAGPST